MKYLITLFFLSLASCGSPDSPRLYEIQGELKTCTMISVEDCGLTVACENNEGIHMCVGN